VARVAQTQALAQRHEPHGLLGQEEGAFVDNDRAHANIHHEAIVGYMEAITMSFEAREPGQLSPFRVSDRVTFSFSDTDGRRGLLSIRKE
jgi:Cu/Ag efflux protein CusF